MWLYPLDLWQTCQKYTVDKKESCRRKPEHLQEEKSKQIFSLHTVQINYEWFKNLSIRSEILKLLQKTKECMSRYTGKSFWDKVLITQEIRPITDKRSLMEVKRFYTTNWIVGQIKRHLTEWDKFLANCKYSRILCTGYKEHKKTNIKKTNHPI